VGGEGGPLGPVEEDGGGEREGVGTVGQEGVVGKGAVEKRKEKVEKKKKLIVNSCAKLQARALREACVDAGVFLSLCACLSLCLCVCQCVCQ